MEGDTEVDELTPEAQTTRQVCIGTIKKELGQVSLPAECVAPFLKPRYKQCGEDPCRNGEQMLRMGCLAEINSGFAESLVHTAKFYSTKKSPTYCLVDATAPLPSVSKEPKLSKLH